MDKSRRNVFKAGVGSVAALALPAMALGAASDSAETSYVAPFPRSILRRLPDRLSDVMSVQDFGARGDGITDDTTAFQNASDAAAAIGKALFIPSTRHGYLISRTVEVKCRRLHGEASQLDGRGTVVMFKPKLISDMMPCFAIASGMYGSGVIENISVVGPHTFSRERSREWVDPARLPNYAAFVAGVCGFAVLGNNQPTFRNVSTAGVKVGLYLDSTDGHVSSYDCVWNGLFGVYCRRNSEDYFFIGGGITGTFAGVVFGTFDHANHFGGMNVTMYRVHMGFSPFGFYQVIDAEFRGLAASLYGRLDAVRFEQIGEAVFQFLPTSITDALCVDNFSFSWSPIHRGSPRSNAWLTNLPPEILPYDDQQQFPLRLGTLAGSPKLGWLGGAWPLSRSGNSKKPGGIASIERLDLRENADLSGLGGDFVVKHGATPASWTRRRGGPDMTKMDAALDTDVTPAVNLLRNPEEPANWIRRGARAQEISLTLSTLADAGGAVPLALIEDLGPAPAVLKIVPPSTGGSFSALPLNNVGSSLKGRNICLTLWIYGSRARVRFELSAGQYLYDWTYETERTWTKVVAVDQSSGAAMPRELQIFSEGNIPYFVCGVMACLDSPRPYTPLGVPRLRYGLAIDEAKTANVAKGKGTAAALPSVPAGYLTVTINGIDRQIAYY